MKNIKISILLLLITVSVFSCKKDKQNDLAGQEENRCQIQRVYSNDLLIYDYETLDNNRQQKNYYHNDTLTNYTIYEKNERGNIQNTRHYRYDGNLYYWVELIYDSDPNLPEIINYTYYQNGEIVFTVSTAIFYNNNDQCKVDRYDYHDEYEYKIGYAEFKYSDDNCSYLVSRYNIGSDGYEYLESETEVLFDDKIHPEESILTPYTINHNLLSRFNRETGILEVSSSYQYNEMGYPETRNSTFINSDGTSSSYEYRYEYDCD